MRAHDADAFARNAARTRPKRKAVVVRRALVSSWLFLSLACSPEGERYPGLPNDLDAGTNVEKICAIYSDSCQRCMREQCTPANDACGMDATCNATAPGTGRCVCSTQTARDAGTTSACLEGFVASGPVEQELVGCVRDACEVDCAF